MTFSTTSGDMPNSPGTSTYSVHITEELRRYDEHLRDVLGLAAGTRKGRVRVIGLLLEDKFRHCEILLARLRPDDVRQFLARRLTEYQSCANASHHATTLRSYLRYRATCGDQVGKLAAVIANPVHWRLATLPRALKAEEADRLLNAAASARGTPKRAYAIVRLALDLGLRSGEIAHLNLNDIDLRIGIWCLSSVPGLVPDHARASRRARSGAAADRCLRHCASRIESP